MSPTLAIRVSGLAVMCVALIMVTAVLIIALVTVMVVVVCRVMVVIMMCNLVVIAVIWDSNGMMTVRVSTVPAQRMLIGLSTLA